MVRRALDLPAISAAIGERLRGTPLFSRARHILLYAPLADEVDVLGLARGEGARFYLPRCAPGRRLAVHPVVPGATPMRSGPFGIVEPDPDQVPEETPDVLDLVIVPALAVDLRGVRLGYGGGYYDRFLARLGEHVETVAVVPEMLVAERLPFDPWDVLVKSVCTEHRFLPIFNGGSVTDMV